MEKKNEGEGGRDEGMKGGREEERSAAFKSREISFPLIGQINGLAPATPRRQLLPPAEARRFNSVGTMGFLSVPPYSLGNVATSDFSEGGIVIQAQPGKLNFPIEYGMFVP